MTICINISNIVQYYSIRIQSFGYYSIQYYRFNNFASKRAKPQT